MIVYIIKDKRDENDDVDNDEEVEDDENIMDEGEMKWGKDEYVLNQILV